MTDAQKRALRTFLQSWIGTFLGLWAMSGISAETFQGISDLTAIGKLAIAAAVGTLPAILSYVQNALEDTGTIPTVLKTSPRRSRKK